MAPLGAVDLRYHGRRRAIAQDLLDHLARVLHLVEQLAGDWCVEVSPNALLLLAHARQHVGVLRHERDRPRERRSRRILACKQKVHDRISHLGIGRVERWSQALLLGLLYLRQHLLRPEVQQALRLLTGGHACLGLSCSLGQHLDDVEAALAALPHCSAGHTQRERQERIGHGAVCLRELNAIRIAAQVGASKHVLASELVERADERAHLACLAAIFHPLSNVLADDLVLLLYVDAERLAREQRNE
eukprot:23525-Chlamydomonas_euryale.AAC.7